MYFGARIAGIFLTIIRMGILIGDILFAIVATRELILCHGGLSGVCFGSQSK
jgi:hypothetical protein